MERVTPRCLVQSRIAQLRCPVFAAHSARWLVGSLGLLIALSWCSSIYAQAEPPVSLHEAVDRLLTSSSPQIAAGPAADGAYLRRLSIDLRGVAPTGEELTEFRADVNPNKRAAWIDRFLADPLHQERMVDWLDKLLMQRRPAAQVDRNLWIKWLRDAVENRVPLDKLTAGVLTAKWWDNSERPALRFFLERTGDPHLITRDVSRVFFGRDMQCNQCHNHPLVDEYLQIDYQGMLAFVSGSGLVEGTTKDDKGADVKSQMYVERPGADAPFESVFEKGVALRSGPRFPVSTELFEPYLEPDARLQAELPAGAFANLPKPPVASRRALLAEQLTRQQPALLARNMANRIWALVFGRGLVHPVDMHHADNPPSHPEALDLITRWLLEKQFDHEGLLRELVLTNAYGRSTDSPLQPWPIADGPLEQGANEISALVASASSLKDKLNAELPGLQAADETAKTEMEKTNTTWREAQTARNTVRAELDKAEAVFNDAKKKSDDAATAANVAAKKHQDSQSRIGLLDEAQAKIQQAIALAGGVADAELNAAIATAKARADAARADLPNLEKATNDAKAAATAALTGLDAPRAKLKEIAAALDVQQKNLATADAAYASSRQAWAQKHSQLMNHQSRITQAENCLTLGQAIAAARTAVTESSGMQTQLVAEQAKVPALEVQVQQAVAALNLGNTQLATATGAMNTAKQSLAKHEAELAQLRETLAQLEKSTTLVTTPDPLKAASAAINETLVAKMSATSGLTSTVAEQEKSVANATVELAKLQAAQASAEQSRAAQVTLVATKKAEVDAKVSALEELKGKAREAWSAVLEDQRTELGLARSRPLSPEHFGQSVLRVTGIFNNYVQAELAELQKVTPLPADADATAQAKRQLQAVRGASDKLRGNVDVFANLYASGVGQTADDYFASPDQALYMANGGSVFAWSGPNGQNVTARMIAQPDNSVAAQDLYKSLLGREATAGEVALVNEALTTAGAARPAVCQELVWGILTSVEFRFYR